jgi:hypothetical protein
VYRSLGTKISARLPTITQLLWLLQSKQNEAYSFR